MNPIAGCFDRLRQMCLDGQIEDVNVGFGNRRDRTMGVWVTMPDGQRFHGVSEVPDIAAYQVLQQMGKA